MSKEFDIPQPTSAYNKKDWEEIHNHHDVITASQLPTVLGLNKYETPRMLWEYKTGLRPPKPKTIAMRRGHAMEPLIHELYEEATGETLKDPGPFAVYRRAIHGTSSALYCTPDRFSSAGKMVEMKAPLMQPSPEDIEAYKVQLQCQMFITQWKSGCLAILAGNDRLRIVQVEYPSEKVIMEWVEKVNDFCERCIRKEPDPSWSMSPDKGEVPFEEGVATCPEMAVDAAEYQYIKMIRDGLDDKLEDIRTRFKATMRVHKASEIVAGSYRIKMSVEGRARRILKVPGSMLAENVLKGAGVEYEITGTPSARRLTVRKDEDDE